MSSSDVITCNHSGAKIDYEIRVGFTMAEVIKLQAEWSREKSEILKELILKHGPKLDDEQFARDALLDYNLADLGWDWTAKAAYCRSSDFIWFFFIAEDKAQGACIVYHPKQSRLMGDNIFYIDYIAASYSNRNRPGYTRRFSGVGSRLISFITNYAQQSFGYRYGFCLHSLPTAEVYYRSLGMTEFDIDPQKENLRYFEACPDTAAKIAGTV